MSSPNLQNQRRERLFRYAPLILWIGLIFFLSSGQASSSETSSFILPLLKLIFRNANEETLVIFHSYIRKFAHLFVYSTLAFWAWRAFRNSSKSFLYKYRYILPLTLVFLVAAIDETNQSYNTVRTGSINDVWLDLAGGTAMILFIYLIIKKLRPDANDQNE